MAPSKAQEKAQEMMNDLEEQFHNLQTKLGNAKDDYVHTYKKEYEGNYCEGCEEFKIGAVCVDHPGPLGNDGGLVALRVETRYRHTFVLDADDLKSLGRQIEDVVQLGQEPPSGCLDFQNQFSLFRLTFVERKREN